VAAVPVPGHAPYTPPPVATQARFSDVFSAAFLDLFLGDLLDDVWTHLDNFF
jgi:hypothetical protein